MRIHFHSSERPTRLSKALTRTLAKLGHPVPYSRVREALAAVYGYRNWNDLIGQVAKSAPSPYDHEIGEQEAASRRTVFIDRLAAALGLPHETAAQAMDDIGPTARLSQDGGRQPFEWKITARRIAASLTARARVISSITIPGAPDGVGVSYAVGSHERAWALSVSPDGRSISFLNDSHASDEFDPTFGTVLQELGLFGGGEDVDPGIADSRLVDVLSRLDPFAMEALRVCGKFSPRAYHHAVALPVDAPFRGVLRDLPMLASEFEHLAHAERNEAHLHVDRIKVIGAADPVSAYVARIDGYCAQNWPECPVDHGNAERALRSIGSIRAIDTFGLCIWQAAFLSFAPSSCLPRTPGQLLSAMKFADRWDNLFSPGISVSPHHFYRELATRFRGDWTALRTWIEDGRGSLVKFGSADAAEVVWRRLASDLGIDSDEVRSANLTSVIAARLGQIIAEGRGLAALADHWSAWDDAYRGSFVEDDSQDDEAGFRALSSTGLLPEGFRDLSPAVLVEHLGIAISDILDPDEGMLVDKEMFHEATIDGVSFVARLWSTGPGLAATRDGEMIGGIDLGDAACIELAEVKGFSEPIWAVCKYGAREPRIPLNGFSPEAIEALSREFGIPIDGAGFSYAAFMESAAWEGLREWVRRRPEIAMEYAGADNYLPSWYGLVSADEYSAGPGR